MTSSTPVYAIANQKGGVGKSATVLGLAGAISHAGGRALLIDLDPQANITTGLGVEVEEDTPTMADLLAEYAEGSALDIRVKTPWPGIDLLPADLGLANRDTDGAPDVPYRLRAAFENVDLSEYDAVLIDCPPSLGRLLLNGLYYADGMILATEAMVDSVRGIENIVKTSNFVQKQVNTKLAIKAIVITRREKNGEQDFRESELRESYGSLPDGGLVARTVTPKRAAWGDAHGTGQSVFNLRGDGPMALQIAFTDLATELDLIRTK
ncbi:Cobyrinic acid ac-diamide synthase OS=Tsukamurella paurometabola (strain ATCC 8368 / DSM / CCUG 35730 / CIP 100753 / JCM 10117 / KCTC 9821 / NBRC 16120/ NCIMB 702349 / NCTC 13040) OX=521096 GN=Tpau_4295 PE=4 SV=1 [Tsukamurella paurometabola]|uniref:Cobyrinic acid ac-diamide synthase n=1 Tax=Tsukamurella paurometabola (strain ATCC 8368 / DSM 20162 / CCUG 35730 / CIP 100753 / JCM 10117 / KCTC 9821 / NBRC 16120 / NCIMB 702349 / NCTC 13040) TaxID=521096 RepID=D5UZ14_TSUPD|nr:AAA family ATPase [Tsukamurella paurometabola]ADG80861.1 Cobyrinic acid ac-diamide synthase [Tsukamurella paurometabola DSM 20162]SUQ39219.1 Sporulation initiation inhibitor protein soj [Tsukamurella paurometabola]